MLPCCVNSNSNIGNLKKKEGKEVMGLEKLKNCFATRLGFSIVILIVGVSMYNVTVFKSLIDNTKEDMSEIHIYAKLFRSHKFRLFQEKS